MPVERCPWSRSTRPQPSAPWSPASLAISTPPGPAPSAARLAAARRAAAAGGPIGQAAAAIQTVSQSIQTTALASQALQAAVNIPSQPGPTTTGPSNDVPTAASANVGASEIICHGSVISVPRAGATASAAPPLQVSLHPSTNRTLANTIATNTSGTHNLDQLEMLLIGADQQTGSMAGILDLPGAAHARTFQSVAGQPLRYAFLHIWTPKIVIQEPLFIASSLNAPGDRAVSGFWPNPGRRMSQAAGSNLAGGPTTGQIPLPQTGPPVSTLAGTWITPQTSPPGPTPQQVATWIIGTLFVEFNALVAAAKAAGMPIDGRLVRVQDHRANAQPVLLGRSIDGNGTSQAGYWLDLGDTSVVEPIALDPLVVASLTELYAGAIGSQVYFGDVKSLYEQPGPRWYRPSSPQVVIGKAGRSFRFGEDGRYDQENGILLTRSSGRTLRRLAPGQRRCRRRRRPPGGGRAPVVDDGTPPGGKEPGRRDDAVRSR